MTVAKTLRLASFAVLALLPGTARATIPQTINFQGFLQDRNTLLPILTEKAIRFRLCNSATASCAAPLFEEIRTNVPMNKGRYEVEIGSVTTGGIPPSIFENNSVVWIEVAVGDAGGANGYETPNRRVRLQSASYAFEAIHASTSAAGHHGDTYVVHADTFHNGTGDILFIVNTSTAMIVENDTDVGIGTVVPAARLRIEGRAGVTDRTNHLRLSNQDATRDAAGIYLDAVTRDWSLGATNAGSAFGTEKFILLDETAGQERFVIDSAGDIGLNEPDPETDLDVVGDAQFGSVLKSTFGTNGQLTLGNTLTLQQADGASPSGTMPQILEDAGSLELGGGENIRLFLDQDNTLAGTAALTVGTNGAGTGVFTLLETGAVTFTGTMTMGGDLDMNGNNIIDGPGDVTINDQLGVAQLATFSNGITLATAGDLNIGGRTILDSVGAVTIADAAGVTGGPFTVAAGSTTLSGGDVKIQGGHVISSGTTPSLSGCGTTPAPTIEGNDTAGRVVASGDALTTCTITFANAYTTTPVCMLTSFSTSKVFSVSTLNTTTLTVVAETSIASELFYYFCMEAR